MNGLRPETPPPKRIDMPLIKGPSTFTAACTCDSKLPGYHRMDCGVYA